MAWQGSLIRLKNIGFPYLGNFCEKKPFHYKKPAQTLLNTYHIVCLKPHSQPGTSQNVRIQVILNMFAFLCPSNILGKNSPKKSALQKRVCPPLFLGKKTSKGRCSTRSSFTIPPVSQRSQSRPRVKKSKRSLQESLRESLWGSRWTLQKESKTSLRSQKTGDF